jgi:predicted RNase H-like nuclease (RuvC/YqgF family)
LKAIIQQLKNGEATHRDIEDELRKELSKSKERTESLEKELNALKLINKTTQEGLKIENATFGEQADDIAIKKRGYSCTIPTVDESVPDRLSRQSSSAESEEGKNQG